MLLTSFRAPSLCKQLSDQQVDSCSVLTLVGSMWGGGGGGGVSPVSWLQLKESHVRAADGLKANHTIAWLCAGCWMWAASASPCRVDSE